VCAATQTPTAGDALERLRAWAAGQAENEAVAAAVRDAAAELASVLGGPPPAPSELQAAVRHVVADVARLRAAVGRQADAAAAAATEVETGGSAAAAAVRHFMRLFGVRSAAGVLPKMNEVYVAVAEAATAIRAMADAVGIGALAVRRLCSAG
jgi:hypothetical protein